MTDDELMAAVVLGDADAYTALVTRHIDKLYRYALRLCGAPDVAEDMVQDTWLTVWQKPQRYKPGKVQFATWLHRVSHNRFIDQARKNRISYVGQNTPDTIPALEEDERLKMLDQALTTLPEKQKAALLLAYMQGFSNREVAHIMNLSTRAVESLQARAKKALAEQSNED